MTGQASLRDLQPALLFPEPPFKAKGGVGLATGQSQGYGLGTMPSGEGLEWPRTRRWSHSETSPVPELTEDRQAGRQMDGG